jgi:PAS domain S-box-containing protein
MSAVMSNILPDPTHHAASALEAAQAALASAEKSADSLKISELRYRRLFEAARDGILLLDSDRGRITDSNPFMTELLGYTHDEMLGKQLWEIGLLGDKEASQEAFRKLRQEDYIRYENLPLRTRNGERREVEFVSNLYREDGHTVIQCNIRDITERKRMDAELVSIAAKNERIAETLQRSMLLAPAAGEFPGILVETCYMAALNEAEVGGDFFDAFAMAGGKVALVVGDVSGKGLAAAGRTAEVKYALRALLHAFPEPEIALGQLNDFICETHSLDAQNHEAFIVLALVVMDTLTGEAAFLAAGAEPTLILRANGTVEPVEIIGLPLGIQPGAHYMAVAAVLASGETVLMATDGITEARRGKAFLGTEGMAALAKKARPTASLLQLSQAIHGGARDFAGGGLRDDVCLLLARRH